MAISRAKIRPGRKTDQLEKILIGLHENKLRYKTTQYSASILKMVRAYQLKNKGEYEKACQYCDECLQLFKKYKLNLNSIVMYNLMISIYSELNNIAKINEYKYERLCMMDENNISSSMFYLSEEPTVFKHR